MNPRVLFFFSLFFLGCLALLPASKKVRATTSITSTPSELLEEIFHHYASNETFLTLEEVDLLLEDLGLSHTDHAHKKRSRGRDARMRRSLSLLLKKREEEDHDDHDHDHDDHDHEEHEEEKVFVPLTPEEMLAIYSLEGATAITPDILATISPGILNQLVAKLHFVPPAAGSVDISKAWGYSFLATFIISAVALIGFLFIKLLKRPSVMAGLIGLGVGVLIGDAVLHLIPSVLGAHDHGEEEVHHGPETSFEHYKPIYVGMMILAGIYLMFLMERLFEMFMASHGGGHSHSHGHAKEGEEGARKVQALERDRSDAKMLELEEKGGGPGTPGDGDSEEYKNVTLNLGKHSYAVENGDPTFMGIKFIGWMILVNDGFHNFVDGLGVGASFSVSLTLGWTTTLAVVLHELPHEIADFAILLRSGFSIPKALLANFSSAVLAIIGNFIGVGLGLAIENAQTWILALTAGSFLYMALVNLLSEIETKDTKSFIAANVGMLFGFLVMVLIAVFEEDLLALGS